MAPRNGNGWERWRGEVSAHLEHLSKLPQAIEDLGERFEKALQDHATLDATFMRQTTAALAQLRARQSKLAGKVALGAALIGALAAAVADAAIRKLVG